MGKTLVATVEDLFFRSKIDATARNLNVPVRFVERKDLTAVCLEGKTAAVLLELSNGSSLDAIRSLRQNRKTRDVPVIGFVAVIAPGAMPNRRASPGSCCGASSPRPSGLMMDMLAPGTKREVQEEPELPDENRSFHRFIG
jgi:hypothetical protein